MEQLETYAQIVQNGHKKEEIRQTNAQHMRFRFSIRPAQTTKVLFDRLTPYIDRLGIKANYLRKCMDEIIERISVGFTDEPLSPIFLVGYSSQMQSMRKSMKELPSKNEEYVEE